MDWQSFVGGPFSAQSTGSLGVVLVLVMIWSLVWKGMALWKAGRAGSKPWFVVLLILNTVGILDILYLYVFSRKSNKTIDTPQPNLN